MVYWFIASLISLVVSNVIWFLFSQHLFEKRSFAERMRDDFEDHLFRRIDEVNKLKNEIDELENRYIGNVKAATRLQVENTSLKASVEDKSVEVSELEAIIDKLTEPTPEPEPELEHIEVDQKVWVRDDDENSGWRPRYFKQFDGERVICWHGGATSFSAASMTTKWDQVRTTDPNGGA